MKCGVAVEMDSTVNSIFIAPTYLSSRHSCYIANNTKVGTSNIGMICKTHQNRLNDRSDRFKIQNDYQTVLFKRTYELWGVIQEDY
jgi:hypothetical protein